MNKKDYKSWVCKFGLGYFSWLSVLPVCDTNGNVITLKHPVPLVYFPIADCDKVTAKIEKAGFHFANSTLHYLAGYHIPAKNMMRALVKDVKKEAA